MYPRNLGKDAGTHSTLTPRMSSRIKSGPATSDVVESLFFVLGDFMTRLRQRMMISTATDDIGGQYRRAEALRETWIRYIYETAGVDDIRARRRGSMEPAAEAQRHQQAADAFLALAVALTTPIVRRHTISVCVRPLRRADRALVILQYCNPRHQLR